MLAPKGINASQAILKHWIPMGIPTIVTHHTMPTIAEVMAISHPNKRTQRIFSKNDPKLLPGTTVLPKGHREKPAILKHWTPAGMPIIVQHSSNPATNQSMAMIAPPNKTHRRFPKHRIKPPLIMLLPNTNAWY